MRIPPNEQRNFVHKRLLRGAVGLLAGGPVSAAAGFVRTPAPVSRVSLAPLAGPVKSVTHPHGKHGIFHPPWWPQPAGHTGPILGVSPPTAPVAIAPVAPPVRRPVSRSLTARPGAVSAGEKAAGRAAKFMNISLPPIVQTGINILTGGSGQPADCGFGRVWDEVQGKCVFGLGQQAGRDDTPGGAVVMGRYGAGEVPGNMVVNRAVCRPGMVVGDDGICYNRSQLKNSEREWPRGRRPLLTGGDMRAISTAARAGRRLERTTKRLQKIGMMKKPAPRARRLPPHQHQITSGG